MKKINTNIEYRNNIQIQISKRLKQMPFITGSVLKIGA